MSILITLESCPKISQEAGVELVGKLALNMRMDRCRLAALAVLVAALVGPTHVQSCTTVLATPGVWGDLDCLILFSAALPDPSPLPRVDRGWLHHHLSLK